MDVPVNVNASNPSICPPGWEKEAEMWRKLNEEIGGHPDFYPLTIKGAYVIGVIHDICTCTNVLLNSNTPVETSFLPAYGIFASGVELLGRCINGNSFDNKSMKDLKIGFKWLGENGDYLSIKDTDPIVKTRMREYSALDLSFLRHYAAHGQAILNATIYEIDVDLLEMLRQKFAKSLENFWHGILNDKSLGNNLAKANIIHFRNHPVNQSWVLFTGTRENPSPSIEDIFNRFNWTI